MKLVSSEMRFAGLEPHREGGGATLRFDIIDERQEVVGSFFLEEEPTDLGTLDGLLARGHRRMSGIVRRWSDDLKDKAVVFESR